MTRVARVLRGCLVLLAACRAPLHAQSSPDRQARLEAQVEVPVHRHVVLTLGTDLRAAEADANRRARVEAGVALPWKVAPWLQLEPRYRYLVNSEIGADSGAEHRLSLEAEASARPGIVGVENRARMERRIEEDERTTRFRNRLRLALPSTLRDGAEWFAWDEAFYSWPDRRWTRNVAAAGLAAPLARGLGAELYYLFQRDYFDAPRDQHGIALELEVEL